MNDRKLVIDTAKKCLFEPKGAGMCGNCPYFQYSTETDDCWFHLMADLIYLLDGPIPLVSSKYDDFFVAWNYETHHFEDITKEEFEKIKEENIRFKEEKNKNDKNS